MARKGTGKSGDPLTPWELRILQLKSEGQTEKQIGETLVRSEETVASALATIYEKMGLYDAESATGVPIKLKDVRAVCTAIQKGLIDGPQTRRVRQMLSRRERDIFQLLPEGATNEQIGDKLGLSTATVKSYLHVVYHKYDVTDRTLLAALAALQAI